MVHNFLSVWLRHAFPFELLSTSDSFLFANEGTKVSDPKTSSSPSPNMSAVSSSNNYSSSVKSSPNDTSTLKIDQNITSTLKSGHNSSVEVRSFSSSPKENSSCNQGDVSPSSNGQGGFSPKITELSSSFGSGTGKSPTLPNFKIFSKFKSAMSKVSKEPSPRTGTNSSIHVGSMSTERSTGSSLMNGIRSKFKVGSASPSPKESSSIFGSSTMPVVLLDITDMPDCPPQETAAVDNANGDIPQSEGFDLHDTNDFGVSSKTDSDKLERKKKTELKMGSYHSKICTVCIRGCNDGDSLYVD